jgi:hypothetical protein
MSEPRVTVPRRTVLRAGLGAAAWVVPAVTVLRPNPAQALSPVPSEGETEVLPSVQPPPPGTPAGTPQPGTPAHLPAPPASRVRPAATADTAVLAATGVDAGLLAAAGTGAVVAGAAALRRARRVTRAEAARTVGSEEEADHPGDAGP